MMGLLHSGLVLILISLAAFMLPARVDAQPSTPVIAGVNRSTLSTDETVDLTVVVSVDGQNPLPTPRLPTLVGFRVAGNSTSTQVSVANGTFHNEVVFTYRLQPLEAGALLIPPITVEVGGRSYQTEPIAIQVTQASGRQTPGASPDAQLPPSQINNDEIFVEALVDNPEPFVGQQIAYMFRYYEAVDALRLPSLFAQPDYTPPALTGFWSEGKTDVTSYRMAVNGRIYNVTELTSMLFPTAAGEATIRPAQITIPGYGFRGDVTLQTDPVLVQVKSLPAGAPAGFSGAVGRFTLTAQVDRLETKVDEPLTLQVTLSGQGNIGVAGEPMWPNLPGWRSFAGDSTLETRVEDGAVVGARLFGRVMVPAAAGESTLPAIPYSYFDPTDASYHTVSSQPIRVTVAPNEKTEAVTAVFVETATPALLAADLAVAMGALKPIPANLQRATDPLTEQGWYWALWLLAPALLGGLSVWQHRQRRLVQNSRQLRSMRAFKQARRSLASLQTQSDGVHLAGVHAVVVDYLSAKLCHPVGGMTRSALGRRLADQGVDTALIGRLETLLETVEIGRFGPSAPVNSAGAALAADAEDLLAALEPSLSTVDQGGGSVRRRLWGVLFVLLLSSGAASGAFAQEGAPDLALRTAEQLYARGQFTLAAESYRQLTQQGYVDGALYYNMGLAYLQAGDLARALWSLRSAERLAPRDPEIQAAISHVRSRLDTALTDSPRGQDTPLGAAMALIDGRLGLNDLAVLALVLWSLLAVFLAPLLLQLNKLRRLFNGAALGAGLLLIVVGLALGAQMSRYTRAVDGVVVAPHADLVSGPGPQFGVERVLPAGAEVTILETRGDWLRIVEPGGVGAGWMPASLVAIVQPVGKG